MGSMAAVFTYGRTSATMIVRVGCQIIFGVKDTTVITINVSSVQFPIIFSFNNNLLILEDLQKYQ